MLHSYFDNYVEGELILFRHKTLPFAAHTFQRQCNGEASCHCTITILSGDDVIKVDSCGRNLEPVSRSPQMQVSVFLNGEMTPGTTIFQYNGGTKYEITLPTGTVIIAEDGYLTFMTITIYSSSTDRGQLEGDYC